MPFTTEKQNWRSEQNQNSCLVHPIIKQMFLFLANSRILNVYYVFKKYRIYELWHKYIVNHLRLLHLLHWDDPMWHRCLILKGKHVNLCQTISLKKKKAYFLIFRFYLCKKKYQKFIDIYSNRNNSVNTNQCLIF